MKLLAYFIAYFTLISCRVNSQELKTIQALSYFYKELSYQYKNLYIFDGSPPSYPFSYEKLKEFTQEKDESLLKKILKKGKKNDIAVNELKSFVSDEKFTSMSGFNQIKIVEVKLNEEEEKLKSLVDSLIKISGMVSDTTASKKINQELDSLYNTNTFRGFLEKSASNVKWLFAIHPYYSFKRYRLFLIEIYQSITSSSMIVKIVKL